MAKNSVADLIQTLWASGKGWILLTISCGWLISLGVRIVYPALLPEIMAEFRIAYTDAGLLLSVLWIAYAAMQFPGGILADHFGEQVVLLSSTITAVIAVIVIITAPQFVIFFGATILLGIGTGLFGPSRVTVLSDVFPDNRNTAVSFSQAAGNAGNTLLPIGAGILTTAYGWRYGFGYLVPVFLLVIAGILLHVPSRTSNAPEDTSGRGYLKGLNRALSDRGVIYSGVIMFCILFFYQGVTGFLPTYLIETKEMGRTTVSFVYGGFFATAVGLQFLSGVLADRYSERHAIVVFIILGVVGITIIPFVHNVWAIVGSVILSAAILGAIPPANTNIIIRLPSSLQGSGYGLLRSLYIGLAATAPPLVGYMADNGRFDSGLLILGGVAFLSVLVSWRLTDVEDRPSA